MYKSEENVCVTPEVLINEVESQRNSQQLLELKESLLRNGFETEIIAQENISNLFDSFSFPEDRRIGIGNSKLIRNLKIDEFLKRTWNIIFDPWLKSVSNELKKYYLEQQLKSEYFIISADGITKEGELVFSSKNKERTKAELTCPSIVYVFVNSKNILAGKDSDNIIISKKPEKTNYKVYIVV